MRISKIGPLATGAAVLWLLGALDGCSARRPTIVLQGAEVAGVTTEGIDFELRLLADNPTRTELRADSLTAAVVLDGKEAGGSVTISRALRVPSGARSLLEIPLSVPWRDVTSLFDLAAAMRDIPFQLDGTITLSDPLRNAVVPFSAKGTIPRDKMSSAMRTLNEPLFR